ncbi:YbhB/YbcL family Raf kinase inhibitor-like protein [Streptomyces boninensis]|uniref:YbhB/YbcL family Raf kinase inhibitor-like protein n=1 Tax=Streptomyces boninensis TaxID=2039455 RepID=UPI003B218E52
MPLNIKDLAVTATSFGPGERMPDRHAADRGNTAPEIEITGVPAGTAELALIMHDPDAPLPHGFTHWVVYGIDPATTKVTGDKAYMGPQPPPGHGTHHYYFWVYALDTVVSGEPSREEFLTTYGPHIIEQNRLVGTFST